MKDLSILRVSILFLSHNSSGDKLTEILRSLSYLFCQLESCLNAFSTTHSPISLIKKLSSAILINFCGETGPRVG